MLTMEEALKLSDKSFGVGQIVSGTIIEVRPKEVLVDIGYKSEGVIPTSEFNNIEELKVSDKVDVLIERLEDREGTRCRYIKTFSAKVPDKSPLINCSALHAALHGFPGGFLPDNKALQFGYPQYAFMVLNLTFYRFQLQSAKPDMIN